jgi:hypothetical protein
MIRAVSLIVLVVFSIPCFDALPGNAQEKNNVRATELQKLVDFLKSKGVELQPGDEVKGSYIQTRFIVGPDFKKKHVIGVNYLPPLTLEEAKRRYIGYSLPHEFHGEWATFRIGGPGGNASPEYVADWKRVNAVLREYASDKKKPKE